MAKSKAKGAVRGGKREGAGRPAVEFPTASVRIDERIVERARIIARRRKVPISELLSDALRERINREFDAIKDQL